MSKLGNKFTCWSCATKFYDLNKPGPKCPKCGANPEDDPKKGQSQNSDDKKGEEKEDKQPKPEPGDAEKDKQKSGELKAGNPGQEPPEKDGEAAEAAEAAAAAQEGRMTEKDAKQLLEALRKFDQRVRLLDPREGQPQNSNRPFKNW